VFQHFQGGLLFFYTKTMRIKTPQAQFLASRNKRAICINAPRIKGEFFAANGVPRKGQIYYVLSVNENGGFEILGKPLMSDVGPARWVETRFRVIA